MVETINSKKTTQLGNKQQYQNLTKSYSLFLFKAFTLFLFCAVVPFFLSQSPELANQTTLPELLHLVLVGIAVSYGLFSRRNHVGVESNNNHPNNNNQHSYLPKNLEVSSVFNVDHETESEPSDEFSGDGSKFQTWRSDYYMKSSEIFQSNDQKTRFYEKPLLLPVRSLNYSRVSDSGDNSGDDRWGKVRSKRKLLKSLCDDDNSEVLPSPIPWRSRSSSSSSSSKEIESQPLIKNLTAIESKPLIKNLTAIESKPLIKNLTAIESKPLIKNPTPSPRKATPLHNLASFESEVTFHGELHPSPPPPPPPPPPPLPAFYNSAKKDYSHRIERRKSYQKLNFEGGEFHPPPPPPARLRVSSERRKSSEQRLKSDDRSSKRKVWWSDPIVDSKEQNIIRQETEKSDRKGFLGSKVMEETEEEEHRRSENEHEKKMIEEEEEEEACGNNSGNDVDKKADEFIAKFREQIRLQRIESIKRSTSNISLSSTR